MGGPNRIAAGCTTGAVVNSACTAYFWRGRRGRRRGRRDERRDGWWEGWCRRGWRRDWRHVRRRRGATHGGTVCVAIVVIRLYERTGRVIEVLSDADGVAVPHGHQICFASAVYVGRFSHAPLHRQRLVVAFEWKIFLVEAFLSRRRRRQRAGRGGGRRRRRRRQRRRRRRRWNHAGRAQEHGQPLRRNAVALRPASLASRDFIVAASGCQRRRKRR